MRILLLAYLAMALFKDLLASAVYAQADWAGIEALRFVREALAAALFVVGFVAAPMPRFVRAPAAAYIGLVGLYAFASLLQDVQPGLVIASAGKLLFPPLLVFAGAACMTSPASLALFVTVLACMGGASALFGMWEIRHTDFWTDAVRYGDYLYDLKGVATGLREDHFLPFNFFGYEDVRRAAGLVAAPLAQGSMLATAGLLALARWRQSRPILGIAALVLCSFGIWQSGTRGAMLMLLVALPLYLVFAAQSLTSLARSAALVALALAAVSEALLFVVSYTVDLADGSTIGHLSALQTNIAELRGVLLLGDGVGAAGSVLADQGGDVAGGGEGALFSIVYQIGVPGGLLFLAFYAVLAMQLYRARNVGSRTQREIVAATCALMIGAATSLILSEHLLAVSAMAPFWLAVGGCAAMTRRSAGP